MAVQIIAQISTAQLVGIPQGDPLDVESDTTAAPQGTVDVHIPPVAGTGGFITLEPIASAIIAAIANGPCTVVVSQGTGTGTYTATA